MPTTAAGICFGHGGTVGRMTVTDPFIRGQFPAVQGDDAIVECDLVPAGKYRNGAARRWCRAHQQYWGVKADLAALAAAGAPRCVRHAEPMSYVLDPVVIDLALHEQLALATGGDGLSIQFSAAANAKGHPGPMQGTVRALALAHDSADGVFRAPGITQVNVTPAAMQAWRKALHSGKEVGCVDCARCGHPHLDLGDFAEQAHRRHYCGNCGHDATHSGSAIVSHPFFALLRHYGARLRIAV